MKSNTFRLHPASLFLLLSVLVIVAAWLLDVYGVSIYNPQTGDYLRVQSLLNAEGARWIMRNSITNFSAFPPTAMVVTSLLGIGIAENSGFIDSLSSRFSKLKDHPKRCLILMALLGVLSNVVGDAGYVFLVPLLAIMAPRMGIHPVVAILVTFVAVACGYSANWMLSSMDPLLARITQDVSTSLGIEGFNSGSYSNYFFMFVSTILITGIIYVISWWVLRRKLEKEGFRLLDEEVRILSHRERRSLNISLGIGLLFLAVVGWLTFSSLGLFRGVSGELVRSPFIMGALFILSLSLGIMGFIYGLNTGKYRNDFDIVKGMSTNIRTLSIYFVIAFFAAQFFAYVSYTRLDQFIILFLGQWVQSFELTNPTSLLVVFILYCSAVNLVMVSAVGKWVLISVLFIPLFAAAGIEPDVVQAAFRIGDSSTNVITPFLYYSPFILALLNRYVPNVSFKFIVKHTWYFSLIILLAWTLFFILWYKISLPFGI